MSRKGASPASAPAATRSAKDDLPSLPPPLTEDANAIIAIAAHELKNALGGIGVALARCDQRLAGGKPVTADDLAVARAEVRRLSALVNGLLDGARVDLGVVHVEPHAFDLGALVREVVQMFCAARDRSVTLELPHGPVEITADAERVRGVLVNYLENAAKYAPPPAALAVGIARSPAGSGCLRLSVRDEGPGIAHADQGRLFQRFFRGPAAVERVHGLGLGLYLCRAIAEAHGGAVGVVSEPGRGATFWLDLPASIAG
jgi:signal transduction histidine kinase